MHLCKSTSEIEASAKKDLAKIVKLVIDNKCVGTCSYISARTLSQCS